MSYGGGGDGDGDPSPHEVYPPAPHLCFDPSSSDPSPYPPSIYPPPQSLSPPDDSSPYPPSIYPPDPSPYPPAIYPPYPPTPYSFAIYPPPPPPPSPPADLALPDGLLVRAFCKAHKTFNLCVLEGGKLALAHAHSAHESQQWIKDQRFGVRIRDAYGFPAFMLINKASKKVLKHPPLIHEGDRHLQEAQLVDYRPGMEEDELFWTESQDFGEGFRTIRMVSNTRLNLSVLHAENRENGFSLVLDTWHKKDNQLWKLFPL